jgi:hypothetical protein
VNPDPSDSLFGAIGPGTPGDWALSLSLPADLGHRDELRGATSTSAGGHAADVGLADTWSRFFEHIGNDGFGELSRRSKNLQRQPAGLGID